MCALVHATETKKRGVFKIQLFIVRESVLCVYVIVCINMKNLNPISVKLVAMSLSLSVSLPLYEYIDCYFTPHRPVSYFSILFFVFFSFLLFVLTCVFCVCVPMLLVFFCIFLGFLLLLLLLFFGYTHMHT